MNEAALLAVKKGRKFVSQKDLVESVEVVFAGKEKKNKILSDEEKKLVAYHETGHALMTVLQKNTVPVQKITIVPRTSGALGYVWQVPDEEKTMETQAEIEADIVIACAGRAAEALKFPSVTTGAASDIQQATEKARRMVTMYGMSEKFGMVQLEGITGEYLDRRAVLQCSDETETKIDTEVRSIIKRAYERAYKLLKKNETVLDAVASFLYDHETITGKEFVEIYEKVSGRKVEMGKRLLSDSLLKSDKDKEREKQKEKAALRKEGYYGVLSDEKKEKTGKKKKEEKSFAPDQGSSIPEDTDAGIPEELPDDGGIVTEPDKPEERITMPWETFARENSGKTDSDTEDSEETADTEDIVNAVNTEETADISDVEVIVPEEDEADQEKTASDASEENDPEEE